MSPSILAALQIKLELLSFGVAITRDALSNYGRPYLQKRRAYGNADPLELRSASIPQELYIADARIMCAVNVRHNSPWVLDFESGHFFLKRVDHSDRVSVTFPLHPRYYDHEDSTGFKPAQCVTLYGGGALGIFVYGDCALVAEKKACHYCSIEPNRLKTHEFLRIISPETVEKAVKASIDLDDGTLNQVMLNGGNFSDLNRSFMYYVRIAEAARKAVDAAKSDLPIHLIVFPPKDIRLIRKLKGLGVEVAFNTEVFDQNLFQRYCPGKSEAGGHTRIFAALEEATSILGKGNVYSIFLGGLEPLESLRAGLKYVANLGATPVINVFHADPETPLSAHPLPTPDQIHAMGVSLQQVYHQHEVPRPFYFNCGRNSLDSEAFGRQFG